MTTYLVGQFNCSSLNPCRNISLRDIDLTSTSTEHSPSFQCTPYLDPMPVFAVLSSCFKIFILYSVT